MKNRFKSVITVLLGVFIILISIFAYLVSTGLSIMYYDNAQEGPIDLTITGFVILLQSMVFVGSLAKGIIYERTPQHYKMIAWFTNVSFIISVFTTVSFFNTFDKTQRIEVIKDLLYTIPFLNLQYNNYLIVNLTNLTLIWASCIVIDLMSMYFPSVGADIIMGISTKKSRKIATDKKSYFTKIREILLYGPQRFIDFLCKKCDIKDYDTNYDTTLKPDTKYDTKYDTKPDTLIKNDTNGPDTKPDTPTIDILSFVKKERNKPVISKDTTPDTKSDTTPDTTPIITLDTKQDTKQATKLIQDTINDIDGYIVFNYNPGDKINVSDLKERFGFNKQDRTWNDKIRNNLIHAAINENKRLIRIDSPEEKIHLVK